MGCWINWATQNVTQRLRRRRVSWHRSAGRGGPAAWVAGCRPPRYRQCSKQVPQDRSYDPQQPLLLPPLIPDVEKANGDIGGMGRTLVRWISHLEGCDRYRWLCLHAQHSPVIRHREADKPFRRPYRKLVCIGKRTDCYQGNGD